MENNDNLVSMPNIGSVLAKKLNEIGISSANQLIEQGSKSAFIKLRAIDREACLHQLLALEGAVQSIRWHDLDQSTKTELKDFYHSCSLK